MVCGVVLVCLPACLSSHKLPNTLPTITIYSRPTRQRIIIDRQNIMICVVYLHQQKRWEPSCSHSDGHPGEGCHYSLCMLVRGLGSAKRHRNLNLCCCWGKRERYQVCKPPEDIKTSKTCKINLHKATVTIYHSYRSRLVHFISFLVPNFS